MIADIDIYRTAQILIDRYREKAVEYAEEQMEEFQNQEDMVGASVWFGILHAIEVLQTQKIDTLH